MTAIVESTQATSTLSKPWKKTQVWLRKCDREYWRFWGLDRPAATTFPRSDRFLRADYLTYFERHNCSPESDEFNASKIIEKMSRFDLVNEVEDVTAQLAATLSPLSTFLRPNQSMRIDYLTYFERHNCSSDWAEFNASEIIEKYQGLT